MAGTVRRVERPNLGGSATLQLVAAALGLHPVRPPDYRAGKHPAIVVAVAARTLLGLRYTDQRTLPAGGTAYRAAVCCGRLEVGRQHAGAGGAADGMDAGRAGL